MHRSSHAITERRQHNFKFRFYHCVRAVQYSTVQYSTVQYSTYHSGCEAFGGNSVHEVCGSRPEDSECGTAQYLCGYSLEEKIGRGIKIGKWIKRRIRMGIRIQEEG